MIEEEEQSIVPGSKSRNEEREREHMLYSCIYSIKDHAQVGWYIKCYWLKEQNVLYSTHLYLGGLENFRFSRPECQRIF